MTAVPKPRIPKLSNALVTARQGFCYLTIRQFGRNHEMMRIRAERPSHLMGRKTANLIL